MSIKSINKGLTIRIIMFSSLVTVFITLLQLYIDFLVDKESVDISQSFIFSSYKDALEKSLWVLNHDLLESQINGIMSIPDITYVRIIGQDNEIWEMGVKLEDHIVERSLSLHHEYIGGKEINIGSLTVQSDLRMIYQKLMNKALWILVSNGIKTSLVAGFIIFIVTRLVTSPLNQMSEYFRGYNFKTNNDPLVIDRKNLHGDEIDFLVNIVNNMCSELATSYEVLVESRKQLAQALDDRQLLLEQEVKFKENLESMVKDRTEQLETALVTLQDTQKSLVEQEKMASLGGLVGGVAHEINTPLGISITANSFLESQVAQLSGKFETGKLTRSSFSTSIEGISESIDILGTNLHRAELLVSSFKQVAVDQTDQSIHEFLFKEHLEKLVVSLSHELKIHDTKVLIECDKDLMIKSYPSGYVQIFSNLITNSIRHGFDEWEGDRLITITINVRSDNLVIDYRDSGKGVPDNIKAKIFEPFVTTKRGKGGTGLGANIVYNLVTQLLKGGIEYIDDYKSGAQFVITVPMQIE